MIVLNETNTTAFNNNRSFIVQEEFNTELEYSKPKRKFKEQLKDFKGSVNIKQIFFSLFPIFSWLQTYSIKNDLVNDLICGVTVAVVQVPQAIGSAMVAKVPPVNGLYAAIFPVLIYVIFGTSKHLSFGSFVIVNLMISETIQDWSGSYQIPANNMTETIATSIPMIQSAAYTATQVSGAICFNVAMIQLLMYVFRLGILSSLLSDVLVSGFTAANGYTIILSQLGDLWGLKLPSYRGFFQIFPRLTDILSELFAGNFNGMTTILSTITIIILLTNTFYLSPVFSKKCPFPIPAEIFCIVTAILVSKFFSLNEDYQVAYVKEIPVGMPTMLLPTFELVPKVLLASIAPAIICYSVSISMAISLAKKSNYKIDFNQDMLAMGLCNLLSAFMPCVPISASISRSVIQSKVGGKTQITTLVSSALLTLALLCIGPFFRTLPVCTVACVICVALATMCLQVQRIPEFWHISRLDGIQWIVTFLTTLFIAIDVGLAVGLFISLFIIMVRDMQPYTCLLGQIPSTTIFLDVGRYKKAVELKGIKIFHYGGSLNFVSRNIFRRKLLAAIGIDLDTEISRHATLPQIPTIISTPSHNGTENDDEQQKTLSLYSTHTQTVIVDFSAITHIDASSITTLKQLITDFKKLNINFMIAACPCHIYDKMKKCAFTSDNCQMYPTIPGAVSSLQISFINVNS